MPFDLENEHPNDFEDQDCMTPLDSGITPDFQDRFEMDFNEVFNVPKCRDK